MITNHLLEAKYQIQKQLAAESGHDIRTYIKNVHKIVEESEKKYGLKFKYGSIQSPRLEMLVTSGKNDDPN